LRQNWLNDPRKRCVVRRERNCDCSTNVRRTHVACSSGSRYLVIVCLSNRTLRSAALALCATCHSQSRNIREGDIGARSSASCLIPYHHPQLTSRVLPSNASSGMKRLISAEVPHESKGKSAIWLLGPGSPSSRRLGSLSGDGATHTDGTGRRARNVD